MDNASYAKPAQFSFLIAAIGVVFGDLGTSPLYTLKECFHPHFGLEPNFLNVLGILSLIAWTLILVVAIKYLTFILRADHEGEGGILTLCILALPKDGSKPRLTIILLLGLLGSAMLLSDGIITPAISVLTAIEGLGVATDALQTAVTPLTVVILAGFFLFQHRGTSKIGAVFGPTMLLWFVTIGMMGGYWIVRHPTVLLAFDPRYAMGFLKTHGFMAFIILGAVFLCVTGCEALYADLGHFNRKSIRQASYFIVLPSLFLNYFGQGAVLLENGQKALKNPFFAMVPDFWVYPLIALATAATIVASQALISAVFSSIQQAVQLKYWPRVQILRPHAQTIGQIYIPSMNYLLMAACLAIILYFEESSRLASLFGFAVNSNMIITTVLFFLVTRQWQWPMIKSAIVSGLFLAVDLIFFASNLTKFIHGSWIVLCFAIVLFTIMITWHKGRSLVDHATVQSLMPIHLFLKGLENQSILRVKGTAVFMNDHPEGTPLVLLHHFKHNKALHETVLLLSIADERVPRVRPEQRLRIDNLGRGFYKLVAHYGYSEIPDVPQLMEAFSKYMATPIDPMEVSYYLGRRSLVITNKPTMPRWQKILFFLLWQNAYSAAHFFGLPPNRVIELGAQIEL